MCRFAVYKGKAAIPLSDILEKPGHSLIKQSQQARDCKNKINADGFGLGWYHSAEDQEPGLFKSIQPAWNDENIKHLARKIYSPCFIGHVRASTVGGVNTYNCHPFAHKNLLFAHNGTIRYFQDIKRQLVDSLNDDNFHAIKGQTDSEYFFALLRNFLDPVEINAESLFKAMQAALMKVQEWQKPLGPEAICYVNSIVTDGHSLCATRYISDPAQKSLGLFYVKKPDAIIIASEALDDDTHWQEVPQNHALLVMGDLRVTLRELV